MFRSANENIEKKFMKKEKKETKKKIKKIYLEKEYGIFDSSFS